ncbi:MAG: NUDIX domain-containing protein [Planctomycetota bacterium]|jgi:8-oxo-dGTP pyrophosphatase MutT (NUDIX family)
MKALRRVLLRVGYRLAGLGRLFRARAPLGAAMAVVHDGRILVVRHSYRSGQSLPGGRVKRGESPRAAALRELNEELSIEARPEEALPVYQDLWVRIFEYRPRQEPRVRMDGVEIIQADFLDPADIREPDRALRGYLLCRTPCQEAKGEGGLAPP